MSLVSESRLKGTEPVKLLDDTALGGMGWREGGRERRREGMEEHFFKEHSLKRHERRGLEL